MNIAVWCFVSGVIGGIVGYWLGYSFAYQRAAFLMDMLRTETEMYLGVLHKKDEVGDE